MFCGSVAASARCAAGSFEESTGVATGLTAMGVAAGAGVAAGFGDSFGDSVVQPAAKSAIATSASERMPTF